MITRAQKIDVIKDAVRQYQSLEKHWEELRNLTGVDIDSPLGNAVWMTAERMIMQASIIAGDKSAISTLEWFVYENDCGNKKLKHSLPNSKRMIVVEDIQTLLRVMGF